MSQPHLTPSAVDSELSDDALTDRVRVLQRRRGHRYSIDDVITARLAIEVRPDARSYLDLGCGIGSVLLMVGDRLPEVEGAGIEAQLESFALAERNVARNGLSRRLRVYDGDLRDATLLARVRAGQPLAAADGFDLVTGTPPYKALGTASISPDPQRAHARVELRGGVEAYALAASQLLAADGRFVMCAESGLEARVRSGASAARLRILSCLDVVPAAGKGSLFAVYCFARETAPPSAVGLFARESLVLRDAAGARTPAANALRAFFGMPSNPSEAPSPPSPTRNGRPSRPE
jgi:tRNA1(Val) A37 N6-methylase TrmN6